MFKEPISRFWALCVVCICISGFSGYIITNTAYPENPATHNYFDTISNMPFVEHENQIPTSQFWEEGGDCTDRALAFKEYLESNGAEDVHLVVARKLVNGKEVKAKYGVGHCFVLWNNRVYNPMNDKYKIYNGDFESYKKALKEDYEFNILFVDCGANGTVLL